MYSKVLYTIEQQLSCDDDFALRNSSQIGIADEQSDWIDQFPHNNSRYHHTNENDQDIDQFNNQLGTQNERELISASTQYDGLTTQDQPFNSSGYSLNEKEEQLRFLSSSRDGGQQNAGDLTSLFNKEDEQTQNSMQNNPSMIFSTNDMEEISFTVGKVTKSKLNSSFNQPTTRPETVETPKMVIKQQIQLQDSPICHTQTRKRRQPLTQEKAKIKKQQESKNMINSIIHYVRLVKDAQKNLKLKKNCSLTQFVQKLVNLKKGEQQTTKNLIKQYFFEVYSVHTLPNSKYIEDYDAYPQYIEAFFNLLDFYTDSKFKQSTEIKSVPFKQFLNLP